MRRLGCVAVGAMLAMACGRTPYPGEARADDSGSGDTEPEPTIEPEPEPTPPDPEPEPTDDEPEPPPEPEPTDDPPPDTDTGMEPEPTDDPPAETCRDVMECITDCLLGGDFMCALGCGQNADPAEQEAAFALMGCVIGGCVDRGQCSIMMFDMACITCLGIGLIAPQPTGCEEEADACM